jgi:hypothetical protein
MNNSNNEELCPKSDAVNVPSGYITFICMKYIQGISKSTRGPQQSGIRTEMHRH